MISPRKKPSRTLFWTTMAGAFCGFLVLSMWWLSREDGVARDALGGLFGIVTTPFFLEATVFLCGAALVVLINHLRQKREGDGWVYLAQDNPPPAESKSTEQPVALHDAIFTEAPEPLPEDLVFDEIEGLLALGALDEAGEMLVALSHDERESARGLEVRLLLAVALGQKTHATTLRAKVDEAHKH